MAKRFVAKCGPIELLLATRPAERDPEQSVDENYVDELLSRLAAQNEVLKYLGYKLEIVDID